MPAFRPALLIAIALATLTACQPDATSSENVAKSTPTATGGSAIDDPCGAWIARTTATCTAFLEGREAAGNCSEQMLTIHTSYSAAEMDNPQIGPRVCSTHLERLANRPAAETLPAVTFGESCSAFGQQVKAECIDTLGGKEINATTCSAKLMVVSTARSANDSDREASCEMALSMF